MGCFSFLTGGSKPSARQARSAGVGCCSCCSCCLCCRRGVTSDEHARKEARAGLEDIIRGYQRIARLDLPPGAAHHLANVRENIVELEVITREAKMLKTRPWLVPFFEEQRDWELLHPDGGLLLRRQMCMAALDDDEWSMGCLFISDSGVAFDSGDIPGEAVAVVTGFVPWKDVERFEKPEGPKTLLTLSLKSAAGRTFKVLKLQLSISSDVEWLEEFSRLRAGMSQMKRVASFAVPDSDEHIQGCRRDQPPPGQAPLQSNVPRFLSVQRDHDDRAQAEVSGRERMLSVDEPVSPQRGPGALSKPSILQQRKNTLRKLPSTSLTDDVTKEAPKKLAWSASEAFAETPTGTPAAQVPPNETPVGKESFGAVTIAQVGSALETDDCLARFVRESGGVSNVSATAWAPSRRMPGTTVRKISFTMVLPKDIPRTISRLISLPETSTVTVVYRLRRTEERVIMTYQTCTHDVTFGENFRVQETILFQPGAGGTEMTKYAEVIWVAPLPWTHGAIKAYIEKKAKADCANSVGLFVRVLKESLV